MNRNISKNSIEYALSGNDIMKILDNNTNIIAYNDLYNINNILAISFVGCFRFHLIIFI